MTKPNLTVERAALEKAVIVHEQIPEFDPSYILDNIDRPDLAIRSKNPYITIARIGDKPAGYMISYDRSDIPDTMHIWLNGTMPQFRKHGVFKALINDAINEAHSRGMQNVTVMSNAARYPSMIKALKALAFEITERSGDSIRFQKRI